MRVTFSRLFIVFAMLATNGCRSTSPSTPGASLPSPPLSTFPAEGIFPHFYWNIPLGTPTIGDRGPKSIRVAVFGLSVQHPGFYFLAHEASVSDALDAAGLKSQQFIDWMHYSGISRLSPDGSYFKVKFPSDPEALRMRLQEGDQIYFSHEVY